MHREWQWTMGTVAVAYHIGRLLLFKLCQIRKNVSCCGAQGKVLTFDDCHMYFACPHLLYLHKMQGAEHETVYMICMTWLG